MPFLCLLRKPLASSFAFAAFAATAASAGAADVTIADAKIAGGKLVITGTTASPNTWVRLDDQKGSDFNAKSGPDGAFSIGVVYHPGDCIVELQKLVSPTTLGAATAALVANCGPVGITPRGAWSAKAAYSANDLVTHEGSSWRAKRDNAGGEPGAASVWELFAAKGESADGGETQAADAEAAAARRVPPTGPAGGALAGTYPNPSLANLAVTTGKIAVGAVTSAKIADSAVTTPRIAAGAVGNGKLAADAVTSPKIADGTITSADVGDDSLTASDLAPNSVGTSELADNAVVTVRIADNAVTSAKILDETIGAADLGPNSVTSSEIASNAVGSSEIATDAVQASEIASNSIDADEVVDFTLTNQDVGVLFAEVNANATLANQCAGCGVTVARVGAVGAGNYEVDFARNIATTCTAIGGLGTAATGVQIGVISVVDRFGDANAVFVETNDAAGANADLAFRVVVVC